MIQKRVTILVGSYEVETIVSSGQNALGRTEYAFEATCAGITRRSAIAPDPGVDYSDEQRDSDVDQARHDLAALVAGDAHVAAQAAGSIVDAGAPHIVVYQPPDPARIQALKGLASAE